jgi:hypothetical protein
MTKTREISTYIKINNFNITDNIMVLNEEEGKKYFLNVKRGSIDALIKTDEGEEVGLKYLELGDRVKIKGVENEDNKIIIKKIYIKTKYLFNTESSEDLEFY